MDIDAAAATPILRVDQPARAAYLRYDVAAIAYRLAERPEGFSALVIGPGGGRDILAALLFGARRVDGVEINPIIVNDVMLGRFRNYSGGIYADPRVSVHVETAAASYAAARRASTSSRLPWWTPGPRLRRGRTP